MPFWHHRPGAFLYESPGLTVTIDQVSGSAADAPTYRPDMAEALPGLSPFILWEWATYRVTIDPAVPDLSLHCGDDDLLPLAPGLYLLRYENALGASRLHFEGAAIPDLPVEVLSHKLGADGATSYPLLYRTMVQKVTDALLTLPFDLTGATAHATHSHDEPPSPLIILHLLRHHGRAIAQAIDAVGYSPHRVLTQEELVRPVALANRLDGAAIRWGLSHPDTWAVTSRSGGGWFNHNGRSVLPVRLLQERAEETFDTHENRFVRHFLAVLLQAAEGALTVVEGSGSERNGLRQELIALTDVLVEALSWPWWEEVGDLVHLPDSSTVLHGKDGYRELWALYPEFLLSRSPFGHGLDRAIAARNVATLYEYWCFLQLIKALQATLGTPCLKLPVDGVEGLDRGASAHFGDSGWRLVFNLPARGGRESYGLGLRPDFTLISPAGMELVLDAKFRLDAPRRGLDEPEVAEASPQASDLYKMHTYRDALGVRAAVALYPGDRSLFYERGSRQRHVNLTLHDLVLGNFEGVGALALRPEGGND